MAKTKKATTATPKAKPIMVMFGNLVNKTGKNSVDGEARVYTFQGDVAKGDVFSVWAHSELAYFKVKKAINKFEYVSSDNNGVALSDLKPVIQKIDFKSYNLAKKFTAKMRGYLAALHERCEEAKAKGDIEDVIKSLKGEKKADVQALVDAIEALKADPESVLED